nr:Mur ligase family protein [Micromonospora sp. DSM 115978]
MRRAGGGLDWATIVEAGVVKAGLDDAWIDDAWIDGAGIVAAGVPVWGEVELAWRWRGAGRWLAVTGTNGKTTTTEMLGAILAAAGRHSTTAGNIGTPIVEAVTA